MILVDANLLLYAEDIRSPFHQPAKTWWENKLSGEEAVGLSWHVITAFVRIAINPRAFERPLLIADAIHRVDGWLEQPPVQILQPTSQHWQIFRKLLAESQANANLVGDAHLAALAIEHGAQLCSADADFSRFKGLKWTNPLVP
jgi:toxin-antitoxin system PIN domain toxin